MAAHPGSPRGIRETAAFRGPAPGHAVPLGAARGGARQAAISAADSALAAQEGAARQDLRILASRARAANLILAAAAAVAVAGIALLLTGVSPAGGAVVLAAAHLAGRGRLAPAPGR